MCVSGRRGLVGSHAHACSDTVFSHSLLHFANVDQLNVVSSCCQVLTIALPMQVRLVRTYDSSPYAHVSIGLLNSRVTPLVFCLAWHCVMA